jgi:opacity protein-like surface antigen
MTTRRVRSYRALTVAGALVFTAAPAFAQQSRNPVADITPYAGYMIYGKFIDGPLGTSLTAANGPVYGATAGLSLSPNIALVGNVGYSSSDIKVGVPFIGGISVGSTNVLMYDGGVQLRMPSMKASAVSPFVQAGVGAMRFDIENRFFKTNATNVAYNIGAGLDYQISPNIGVRVMAKDYVGKFDFKDATQFDFKGQTAHNVALSFGVKLGF